MRIRRHLRAARVSALTSEERREALLAAEHETAQKHQRPEPGADAAREATPNSRAGTS